MDRIEECLRKWGISLQDYRDVILALFQVAPKDPTFRSSRKLNARGYSNSPASVSRNFGNLTIAAEDRGVVYAVWVKKNRKDGIMEETLEFAEFPWGQVLPTDEH